MNLRVVASLALAVTLALAGCSESESGAAVNGNDGDGSKAPVEPGGEPTADGPAEPSQPAEDVPTVADPIEDIANFRDDPCSMLTDEQASRIGYVSPKELDRSSSDACDWSNEGGGFSIGVAHEQALGLQGPYGERDRYDYFEPTEINGFPGLYAGYGDTQSGDCGLSIAITDEQLLNVDIQLHMDSPDRERPCEVAKEAGGAALETLKAAQ